MRKLSDAIEEYIQSNPHWQSHTEQRIRAHFRVLMDGIGDKPIRRYTKDDFRQLRYKLPKVSSNATKRGVKPFGVEPYLSIQSVNDLIGVTRTLWRWMLVNYDELEDRDVSVCLTRFKAPKVVRRAMPDDVLGTFIRTTSEPFFVRVLALTGMRLSELAGLAKEDFNESEGILYVQPNHIRGLKTGYSHREVPLHQSVDKSSLAGCLSFCRTQARIDLLGKKLNRELRKVTPDKLVTIHSLRHRFATKLKDKGVGDSIIADLLGHAPLGVTGRYMKRASLPTLREAIGVLDG